MQQVGQYVKLRGDAALEQEVARVVETELSRGQVGFLLTFVLLVSNPHLFHQLTF